MTRVRLIATRGLEWLSGALLFAMMALTFCDVVGRYIFNAPIFGAAEMIQFLLMGCVFGALGVASVRDSHIAVELISPALEARFPIGHRIFVGLFSLAGLVLVALQLTQIGLHSLTLGRVTVVLEWPIAAIALPSAALCFLAAVLMPLAGRAEP